jgi:hypothetical protein
MSLTTVRRPVNPTLLSPLSASGFGVIGTAVSITSVVRPVTGVLTAVSADAVATTISGSRLLQVRLAKEQGSVNPPYSGEYFLGLGGVAGWNLQYRVTTDDKPRVFVNNAPTGALDILPTHVAGPCGCLTLLVGCVLRRRRLSSRVLASLPQSLDLLHEPAMCVRARVCADYSDLFSGMLVAGWRGETTDGVDVRRTTYFHADSSVVQVTVVVTNNGSGPIDNVLHGAVMLASQDKPCVHCCRTRYR